MFVVSKRYHISADSETFGTVSSGVKTLMQGFDGDLAMLQAAYEKAGVLQRTIFVLMADHGMMPLDHRVAHRRSPTRCRGQERAS